MRPRYRRDAVVLLVWAVAWLTTGLSDGLSPETIDYDDVQLLPLPDAPVTRGEEAPHQDQPDVEGEGEAEQGPGDAVAPRETEAHEPPVREDGEEKRGGMEEQGDASTVSRGLSSVPAESADGRGAASGPMQSSQKDKGLAPSRASRKSHPRRKHHHARPQAHKRSAHHTRVAHVSSAGLLDLGKTDDQKEEEKKLRDEQPDEVPPIPEAYVSPPPQVGFPYTRWADDPSYVFRTSIDGQDLWKPFEGRGEPTYPLRGMFSACDCEGTTKRERKMDYYSYYNEYFVRLRGCKASNCVNCLQIVKQLDGSKPGRFQGCDEKCSDNTAGELPESYEYIRKLDPEEECGNEEDSPPGTCRSTCSTCDTCAGTTACGQDEVAQACMRSCKLCPCDNINPQDLCSGEPDLDVGKCVMLANEAVTYKQEIGETYQYQMQLQQSIAVDEGMGEAPKPETDLEDKKEVIDMLTPEQSKQLLGDSDDDLDLFFQNVANSQEVTPQARDKASAIMRSRQSAKSLQSNVQARAGNIVCQQMGCCSD